MMKTLYLLVLLTQNGAGDINAAFVNSESREACEQSRLMVEAIFRSRDIPVRYQRCLPSELRFTPFAHADSTRIERHHYLIVPPWDREVLRVERTGDQKRCRQRQDGIDAPVAYCASSIQRLLD